MKLSNVSKGKKARNKQEVIAHLEEGNKCHVVNKHGILRRKKDYAIFIPTKHNKVMVSKFDPSDETYKILTRLRKGEDVKSLVDRVL